MVETGVVDGWDDPRMPTLCGMRRRGYTPQSIIDFINRTGVSKAGSLVDIRQLEACLRDDLNRTAPRRIAIEHPVRVVITNYPEGKTEYFDLPNNPQDETAGTRKVPFTRELYIDAADFAEVPPPKFFRMKEGGEVRLMGAYLVKCNEVVKHADGTLAELRCTADLETGNGNPADGRKVKGTIHWLSAPHAIDLTLHLYNNLMTLENPSDKPEDKEFSDFINPDSLVVETGAKGEPALADAKPGDKFQFVRFGYFCLDTKHPGTFNRAVGLKDSFPKA